MPTVRRSAKGSSMSEGHVTGTGDRAKISAVPHCTRSTHLRPGTKYSCVGEGSSSERVTHACHEQQLSIIGGGSHVEHRRIERRVSVTAADCLIETLHV